MGVSRIELIPQAGFEFSFLYHRPEAASRQERVEGSWIRAFSESISPKLTLQNQMGFELSMPNSLFASIFLTISTPALSDYQLKKKRKKDFE